VRAVRSGARSLPATDELDIAPEHANLTVPTSATRRSPSPVRGAASVRYVALGVNPRGYRLSADMQSSDRVAPGSRPPVMDTGR